MTKLFQTAIIRYIGSMNKYDPITSEFASAEEEAAYDKWFRAKVEKSLANDKNPIPHDEVMAEMRTIIEKAKVKRSQG